MFCSAMLPHPQVFNAFFGHFKNTFPCVTLVQATLPYQYTVFNNDFNKYNWKQWRYKSHMEIISNCHNIIFFAMSENCVHSYVSSLQSIESTKNFSLQNRLRYSSTIETIVIVIGLFRSSLFISGLTLFGLWIHQLLGKAFVHAPSILSKTSSYSLKLTCFIIS